MVRNATNNRRGRRRTGTDGPGTSSGVDRASADHAVAGGRFRPLKGDEQDAIIEQAFAILTRIGMADAPDWLRSALEENGARSRADGRLTFARGNVERAIARAAHSVTLPGFLEDRGLQIGGGRVHIGTGGAAVQVLDAAAGSFRDSHLTDLYAMMRVLEDCPNIHYGVRPLIARDMPDPKALDINTAYACLRGTGKPIGISFDRGDHVAPVTDLFDLALGSQGAFRHQPFCMAIIVHVVPPLRFAEEGVGIMRAAIDQGMPLQICSAWEEPCSGNFECIGYRCGADCKYEGDCDPGFRCCEVWPWRARLL